ncbi:MAG: NAD synthetase / Glutamine amidotransferase chain of NAD synthetase [uncultured Nocardioidaceae bacterium]|uniref:Glutamine-dependent NAD(+) synthetase n=1 Tax=uncultured Nocardioidaceae bacterium TaxID=253824 RepID=A0A6J4MNQ7_9ACTN|nr:MAG: NAD synthetase / Glutamine amidotransferase chain of NAD synthetase [uncultured Nocardioidaceae bacterium]
MPQLTVALAQVNPTVGDLAGNAQLVLEWTRRAGDAGAHVVAFPEMMLTGYPIEDLAFRSSFVDASRATLDDLAAKLDAEGLGELVVVVGYLGKALESADRLGVPRGSPQNCAAVVHRGAVVTRYSKHHLPNYGVFDEARYFVPGDTVEVIRVGGVDVAVCICEDLWQDGPSMAAKTAGAGLLLVINGSPFEANKDDSRLELCARRAIEGECALAYVNMVGGQDELVFDGDSLVVDAGGALVARAGQFTEELLLADLDLTGAREEARTSEVAGLAIHHQVIDSDPHPPYDARPGVVATALGDHAESYQALVLGLRDYVRKNRFATVLLGMSGGIDSTLVAAIACDAVGPENVYGVSNPSAYSSEHSKADAAEQAERTGLNFVTVPIPPMVEAFQRSVQLDGLAAENLQARIRAVIWMGLSNQSDHLVLACGNKSELAVGYSTLYGDAVGGFAPLKDVFKTQVWELAKWRNREAERTGQVPPIPQNVIVKEPSAELSPGQKDSDSLPPYPLLDAILEDYIECDHGSARLVADGYAQDVVEQVLRLVDRAEYKRRQYPPGPKVSARNFGRDRRLPITNAWREVADPDRV